MKLSAAVSVLALLAVHLLLHAGLGLGGVVPDLATVAVLAGSRMLSLRAAALTGFLVGVAEDSLAMGSFGANALAMTLLGAGGARSRDLFVGESLPFLATYMFAGKWLHDLIVWIAAGSARTGFAGAMLVDSPVQSLYAAAVGVVLWLVLLGSRR